MPNPDGTPLWNEPGFVSTLQQYQNLGGDMNRAAEFLYAGAGANDPTQSHSTILDRIKNMEAPETDWQRNQNMLRDQGFASGFLNSQAYNPNGANSYAISNNVGYNSGTPTGKYWNTNTKTWGTQSPYLATLGNETRKNGNPQGTIVPGNNPTSNTGTNLAENTGGLRGTAKRSTAGAFSDAPQYSQFSNMTNNNLGGLYSAQNLDQSLVNRGTPANRGIDFSKALWR